MRMDTCAVRPKPMAWRPTAAWMVQPAMASPLVVAEVVVVQEEVAAAARLREAFVLRNASVAAAVAVVPTSPLVNHT